MVRVLISAIFLLLDGRLRSFERCKLFGRIRVNEDGSGGYPWTEANNPTGQGTTEEGKPCRDTHDYGLSFPNCNTIHELSLRDSNTRYLKYVQCQFGWDIG